MKYFKTLLWVPMILFCLARPAHPQNQTQAPTPSILQELQGIQKILGQELRDVVLLFYRVDRRLAQSWNRDLAKEAARVANLVMDLETNYQWSAEPFTRVLSGPHKEKFIRKILAALSSEEKESGLSDECLHPRKSAQKRQWLRSPRSLSDIHIWPFQILRTVCHRKTETGLVMAWHGMS